MANSDQIKALIKSHSERDDKRFYAVALQVAASAAKSGHHKLATELKELLSELKSKGVKGEGEVYRILPKNREIEGLFSIKNPEIRKNDMVLTEEVSEKFNRIILEQRQAHKLKDFGLEPRKKILLVGPPGTGKTMLANAFAGELKIPLYTVLFDSLITKYMGETASKLRSVFDVIHTHRGVYFFDEFDAIGGKRGTKNDVGEMRRILNSFLQFLEEDSSENLVLAATNHPEILDKALFRRFDDIIEFSNPSPELISRLINNYFRNLKLSGIDWEKIISSAEGLSYAEISKALVETLKELILFDDEKVTTESIIKNLKGRMFLKSR